METLATNLHNVKLKAKNGKTPIYNGRRNYEGGISTITILIAIMIVSIILLSVFMGG